MFSIFDQSNLFSYDAIQDEDIDIWSRPVRPVYNGICSCAVAFVSRRADGAPHPYKITVEHLGLLNPNGYTIMVNIFKYFNHCPLFFLTTYNIFVRYNDTLSCCTLNTFFTFFFNLYKFIITICNIHI